MSPGAGRSGAQSDQRKERVSKSPGRLAWIGRGAWAVADGIYLYQSAVGTYSEGTPLDSVWLLGDLAIAVHPS